MDMKNFIYITLHPNWFYKTDERQWGPSQLEKTHERNKVKSIIKYEQLPTKTFCPKQSEFMTAGEGIS